VSRLGTSGGASDPAQVCLDVVADISSSGIQTMPAWIDTFGVLENGQKVLTTGNQSLVVSILSAGVSRTGVMSLGLRSERFARLSSEPSWLDQLVTSSAVVGAS
jgi:hypothetical protein